MNQQHQYHTSKKRCLAHPDAGSIDTAEAVPSNRQLQAVIDRLARAIKAGRTLQDLLLAAVRHDSPDACALLLLLLGFETELSSEVTAQDLFCRLPYCIAAAAECMDVDAAISYAIGMLPHAPKPRGCLGQIRHCAPATAFHEGFGITSTAAAMVLLNTIILVPSSNPRFMLPTVFCSPAVIFDIIQRDRTPEELWTKTLLQGVSPASLADCAFNMCAWYGSLPMAFASPSCILLLGGEHFQKQFTDRTFTGTGWHELRESRNADTICVFTYDQLAVNAILWSDWRAKLRINLTLTLADLHQTSAGCSSPKCWSEIVIDMRRSGQNSAIDANLLDFVVHAEVELYHAYPLRDQDEKLKRLFNCIEKYGVAYLSCLVLHFPTVLDASFDDRTFGYYLLENVVNRVNLLRPARQTDIELLNYLRKNGYVKRHADDYSTEANRATFSKTGIYSYDAFYSTMITSYADIDAHLHSETSDVASP